MDATFSFVDLLLAATPIALITCLVVGLISQVVNLLWAFGSVRNTPKATMDMSDIGVTVLMPAYNEGPALVDAIETVLSQRWHDLRVFVIDDGSTDGTAERLVSQYAMENTSPAKVGSIEAADYTQCWQSTTHPGLLLFTKENGGAKAGALNCALNYVTTPWFICTDGDTLLEPDCVEQLVLEASVDGPGPTIAVGGSMLPSNDVVLDDGQIVCAGTPTNPLVGWQTVEYMIAFLVGRPGMAAAHSLPFASGGLGLFLTSAVRCVDGYDTGSVGEDLDLCIRMHRHFRDRGWPYQMRHSTDALAWTELPASLKILGRQRRRWQHGLIEVSSANTDLVFNRKYGRLGFLGYPTMHLVEFWGGLAESLGMALFIGSILFNQNDLSVVIAATALGIALSSVVAAVAVTAGHRYGMAKTWGSKLRLVIWAGTLGFGYRQLNSWWRLQALFTAPKWERMERTRTASTVAAQ